MNDHESGVEQCLRPQQTHNLRTLTTDTVTQIDTFVIEYLFFDMLSVSGICGTGEEMQ